MRHEKLSPGLLLAYEDYEHEGEQALTTHKRSLGIIAPKSSVKPTKSIVFLYCEPDADLSHLEQYGIRVNQTSGSVRTAFLPLQALDPLSEEDVIQRIKPSRKLHLRMDAAPGKVKLPEFKNKTGLTGKGVLIGIVDSGIDPKHPAFAGRILRIWDQTLPGPGVKEGDYGAEFTGEQITVSQDTDGHGTHVAGIAAGADENFSGVAPEAELVIVKSDLQDAHIADAVRYVFRVASDLKRPVVLNLSLGGHADSHDGSDSLSRIIDAETGPGRIVCCAAGNEGNDNIHGQTKIAAKKSASMRFNVPLNQVGIVWLNGWYDGDTELEVSLRSPNGFVTPYQKIIKDGNPTQDYQLPDSRVQIVTPAPDKGNGDHNFFVQIRGNGPSAVMGGIWQLRLRNTTDSDTRLDVWAVDDHSSVFFTGKSVKDAVKIGSPGAASSAITVAAYTTKNQYTDIDNQLRDMGLELDTMSEFSSEGPLRNDAQKPDIAAPGAMIVSTLSANASLDRSMMLNSKFVVMAGTSMATPFVTGLVALLLQRDPKLDPATVKDLLRKNSSIPGKPPGTFDSKWGFGVINAANL
ncbi:MULTISPECIES: S8 family peptidase [unclassified Tolypothrix]|uniref:S8 family peptidase n=1 Tax=unclassified Tolypothrix TaxID=2649714 RepID=UPI0005EAA43B|nr:MULTISPECIES: S8 family peptidase [unclassified Tolypothrix]BAY92971.1 peptidase S8/S53 [Microchaete diplosiphon NIES-3275]EKF03086.1 peptidase families S8 and S53 [Tolypothrix sp. PCC 7601]MBE9083827.1 S8 family peptidase [Tolypothrix sp. LEGE 11397]UYD26867.1 S8 family peptidase [Tolypothrix sp. PCC 7712]UYD37275.1 S8 family peptidase [Tolypothrix sp. PCC 7601]